MILEHLNIKNYFLRGKLRSIISCDNDSNISKFFDLINKKLNEIIDNLNDLYLSIYPCLGVRLIEEHEKELGLPDAIFDINKNLYVFPYEFPIPFYDSVDDYSNNLGVRQRDIFVKKYLMNNNNINGFKAVAGCYGYSIKVDNELKVNFTFKFPLRFQGIKTVKITIYNNPDILDYQKLKAIFDKMLPIHLKLEIITTDEDNIYNPYDYCPCKEFK